MTTKLQTLLHDSQHCLSVCWFSSHRAILEPYQFRSRRLGPSGFSCQPTSTKNLVGPRCLFVRECFVHQSIRNAHVPGFKNGGWESCGWLLGPWPIGGLHQHFYRSSAWLKMFGRLAEWALKSKTCNAKPGTVEPSSGKDPLVMGPSSRECEPGSGTGLIWGQLILLWGDWVCCCATSDGIHWCADQQGAYNQLRCHLCSLSQESSRQKNTFILF